MNCVLIMIRAVLFDMDGVLIDSELIYLTSLVKCLASIGIHEEMNRLSNLTGMKSEAITRELIARYDIKGISVDALMQLQDVYFDKEIEHTQLHCMEGLVDFLEGLKASNRKIALASSSDAAWIAKVLTTLKLRPYFDVIISAEQVSQSKPHPQIFLKAAKSLQVSCEECVVIEDSLNGIMAGKRAGMLVIGFKGSKVVQDTSNADKEVNTFEEIDLDNIVNLSR